MQGGIKKWDCESFQLQKMLYILPRETILWKREFQYLLQSFFRVHLFYVVWREELSLCQLLTTANATSVWLDSNLRPPAWQSGGNQCKIRWTSGDIWAINIHLYLYISVSLLFQFINFFSKIHCDVFSPILLCTADLISTRKGHKLRYE